jgi:hypothetical protein
MNGAKGVRRTLSVVDFNILPTLSPYRYAVQSAPAELPRENLCPTLHRPTR